MPQDLVVGVGGLANAAPGPAPLCRHGRRGTGRPGLPMASCACLGVMGTSVTYRQTGNTVWNPHMYTPVPSISPRTHERIHTLTERACILGRATPKNTHLATPAGVPLCNMADAPQDHH
eukprot:365334-Chlamydomonas_euryale.AAC.22